MTIKECIKSSKVIGISVAVLAMVPMICKVLVASVGPDSAYYLSYASLVAEGKQLYTELPFGYTPVFIMFMAGLKSILGVGACYAFDLSVFFALEIGCAFFCFLIAKQLLHDFNLALLSTLFFIVSTMRMEGMSVMLEVPSLLCGLCGLWLLFDGNKIYKLILSGGAMCLAMMTKQYGLGFFVLGLLVILLFREKKIKDILVFSLTFILVSVTFFLIFPGLKDVFLGGGYSGWYDGKTTNGHSMHMGWCFAKLIKEIPVLAVTLPLAIVVFIRSKEDRKIITFLMAGIFGFMLQHLFGPFSHYNIMLMPFTAILVFLFFRGSHALNYIYKALVGVSALLLYAHVWYNGIMIPYLKDTKRHDEQLAKEILKRTSPDDRLYIGGGELFAQYYLTGLRPPEYRYGFGNFAEDYYLRMISEADCVIAKKDDSTLNTDKIVEMLTSEFDAEELSDGNVLYKRNVTR